jgi:hypothetical protein
MLDVLLDLPAHLRERLAGALESGLLAPPTSVMALRSVLGSRVGCDAVAAALVEAGWTGVSAPVAAAWIRSLERVAARVRPLELVRTGPEVPGLHARDTPRVYEALLGSAERSVGASTYAFFDGPRAFEVLARRMEARSDLRVTPLLNLQRRRGDTTASEHLGRRFPDRFWTADWPGARRPGAGHRSRHGAGTATFGCRLKPSSRAHRGAVVRALAAGRSPPDRLPRARAEGHAALQRRRDRIRDVGVLRQPTPAGGRRRTRRCARVSSSAMSASVGGGGWKRGRAVGLARV